MNHGQPLGIRKTIRVMIALTILAWATQTLFAQWARGAEPALGDEVFVASASTVRRGAMLQMRGEATVSGTEVKLKQICRWAEADEAFFSPLGELVVMRLGEKTPFRTVSVPEIKGVLHDAGINIVAINFTGALTCTVERSDVQINEADALQQWIAANSPAHAVSATPAAAPEPPAVAALPDPTAAVTLLRDPSAPQPLATETATVRTLRDALVDDLAQRTGIAAPLLQVTFDPKDNHVLNLAEPLFQFRIEPQRGRALGSVHWEVVVVGANGEQTVSLSATAQAWQEHLVLTRPLAARQVVQASDLVPRRTLSDRIDSEPSLTIEQAVGNQVSRDLKPGTVLTGRMIEPVPLVRAGQFVTVTLTQGSVRIKTVGRAMDDGAFGQTVRVKNEATRDIYQVVMTGPQTAEMTVGDQPGVASANGD